jgi:predicted ribosome quality control (RQC) complex YloA/Tae2 family protein
MINFLPILIIELDMKSLQICGIDIKIGSNVSDNDKLFDLADDNDIWFHVDGLPSAHMWVPECELTKQQLYMIALQLKKTSKYKKINNIPIIYTTKQNIEKGDTLGTIIITGKSKKINV